MVIIESVANQVQIKWFAGVVVTAALDAGNNSVLIPVGTGVSITDLNRRLIVISAITGKKLSPRFVFNPQISQIAQIIINVRRNTWIYG